MPRKLTCNFCYEGRAVVRFSMDLTYRDVYACEICLSLIELENWYVLGQQMMTYHGKGLPEILAHKKIEGLIEEFKAHLLDYPPKVLAERKLM